MGSEPRRRSFPIGSAGELWEKEWDPFSVCPVGIPEPFFQFLFLDETVVKGSKKPAG